jgi:lipopolysaccharide assembly outer membrane protein LptD (OstA)
MTELHKFRRKNFCFLLTVISFSIAITRKTEARSAIPFEICSTLTTDTIPRLQKDSNLFRLHIDSAARIDSARNKDTLPPTDTTKFAPRVDTFSLKLSKDTLDAPVNYEAEDSAVLWVKEQKMFLYGKTKTTYKDATLTAPKVMIDQVTNIATAYNYRDSLGNVVTRAHLQQGTEGFQSDTIAFNFKTQRGLTTNTFTKQDEMWVQANLIKKVNTNTTYAKHVTFTTCDFDEPHFGFISNKGKFVSNKVAITGPVHPVFEGVPLPIYLPFGIFPLNPGRHSGLLPPQFVVNEQYGLGLEGLGYYHVLNDYLDVTLRTNIYSYGGWSANITPTYRKRYKYSGSFNFSYIRAKLNFKGDPDYSLTNTYNISWNHSMNKTATGSNFSASVNAGSVKYHQYVPYNPIRNVTNNQASSINYSKTWKGTPFNLTMSANQNQNSSSHLVQITLPDAGFTVATIYPFQRKEVVGAPKWYEKIGVGYSGNTRSQVSFNDTLHNTLSSIIDTAEWGAQHRIPISLSLPPLGKMIVSPSISYEETWLQHRIRRRWNDSTKTIDTISNEKGLFTDRHMSFGVGFNTTLYGTVAFKKSRVVAIRHVVRPTFSLNYTPNLSKSKYDVIRTDSGSSILTPISQFNSNRIYSGYGYGKFGGMSFGIDNNLEMKWRSKKDTGINAIKKIRLIDGFGFNSGYNFLATAFKLVPFNLYLRSTLFEKISLTANALLDPYQVNDSTGQPIDRYAWKGDHFSLGRITSAQISMSTRFQSKPRDPNKAPNPNAAINRRITDPALLEQEQRLQEYMKLNPAEFVDFNIPWSLDISYSMSFNKTFVPDQKKFKTTTNANVSLNGSFSLTPKWNFTTNGFYDFDTKRVTTFTMSISRDMHCWQMSINVTPIGNYRYFNITINPKSSILQDLRVNRTRTFVNY